jgi:uncharacterized protein (TIGR03435 family)
MLLSVCLSAGVLSGQAAFEAATVKANPAGAGETSAHSNAAGLQMNNVTLRFCIERAYRLIEPQVLGPAWLDSERYDIIAKAPSGSNSSQIPDMLRALIDDRFKLATHRDKKEMTVYALVVAKGGPKMKKEEASEGGGMSTSPGFAKGDGVTMGRLTEMLSGPRADLGLPVIDQTGLEGRYSFILRWTPEGKPDTKREANGREAEAAPAIFTALPEQLGLKLEKRKMPVEVLVIDHAEKVPAAN